MGPIGWLVAMVALEGVAPSFAAPPFRVLQLDPALGAYCAEHLGQRLVMEGVPVISAEQLHAMIGVERQRQLLGCIDADSSCLAELGDAVGAKGMILGSVAKLGDRLQIDIKVTSTVTAKVLAAASVSASSEKELVAVLDELAVDLARQLRGGAPPSSARPLRRWSWLPVVGALLLGGGSAVGFLRAGDAAGRLDPADGGRSTLEYGAALQVRNEGVAFEAFGYAAAVAAAALVVAAAVMFFWGNP